MEGVEVVHLLSCEVGEEATRMLWNGVKCSNDVYFIHGAPERFVKSST